MLSYLERNALFPDAENETVDCFPISRESGGDLQENQAAAAEAEDEETWAQVDESQKPALHVVDSESLERERKQIEMWRQFEETGVAPDPILGLDQKNT